MPLLRSVRMFSFGFFFTRSCPVSGGRTSMTGKGGSYRLGLHVTMATWQKHPNIVQFEIQRRRENIALISTSVASSLNEQANLCWGWKRGLLAADAACPHARRVRGGSNWNRHSGTRGGQKTAAARGETGTTWSMWRDGRVTDLINRPVHGEVTREFFSCPLMLNEGYKG